MFVQANAAQSLENEIYRTTSALLSQAQHNIDMRMNDIRKISMQLNWNTALKQLLYDDGADYPANKYNEIAKSLRSFQASNSFVERIMIFPEAKDVVITQNATLHGKMRDLLISKYRLPGGERIDTLLGQRHYGELVFLSFAASSGTQQKIALVQSLPFDAMRQRATLFILIDNSILLDSMNIDGWLVDNEVFVLDKDNQVVTTNAPFELPEALSYDALSDAPSRFSLNHEQESFTVMHAVSDTTGWKYIFMLPNRILFKKLNDSTAIFRASIVIFLLLGLVISFLFARRNYFPLKRLTAVFEKESGILFTKGENEFRFIENAIGAALGKSRSMNDAFSKQFIHLRSSFLVRLLKNNLALGTSIDEMLEVYDISFVSSTFAVILFHISEITGESLGRTTEQRQRVAKYVVYNVFEEIANRKHYGFVTEVDDIQALLLNVSSEVTGEQKIRETLSEMLLSGISYIGGAFGITLCVSVSNIKSSLNEVPEAYMEAYTAIEYDIIMGNCGLTFYSNVELNFAAGESGYYYYYPLQLEVQLSNFIKAGDYNSAKKIIDELFRVNFEQRTLPKPIIRCFMFNLTSTIMKTIYEINLSGKDEFSEGLGAVEQLLSCQSVTEINMLLNQLLIDLCAYTLGNGANNFSAEAEAFVQQHFSDPNLDITMIASHLDITSSYLSKKFKTGTGVGLLDFINRTRIAHAKEMLKNEYKSIAHIASACGFVNSNTFIRVFKKYEGITPGRYRELSEE